MTVSLYSAVYPDDPKIAYLKEEDRPPIIFEERGGRSRMKVINVMEFNQIVADKQKSLETDYNLYRHDQPEVAEVAKWGMELLEEVKNITNRKAFEATINQYKSSRNGG